MFLIHITHPCGTVQILSFSSAFSRGLYVIALAAQPVTFTLEDR